MCEPACKWKIRNWIGREEVAIHVRVTATIKITELGLAKRAYAVCNETELEPFSFLLEQWANTINLCGVQVDIIIHPCTCDASDWQHVWKRENWITTFDDFSLNFTKKVKNCRKKREIYYSLAVWSIFVDAPKTSTWHRPSTSFSRFGALRFGVRPHVFDSFLDAEG
jgi:hypothetical protein